MRSPHTTTKSSPCSLQLEKAAGSNKDKEGREGGRKKGREGGRKEEKKRKEEQKKIYEEIMPPPKKPTVDIKNLGKENTIKENSIKNIRQV